MRVCVCAKEVVTACVVRCTGLGSSQWILTVSLPASTAVAECRGSTAVSLSCLSIGASSNFALPAAALGIVQRTPVPRQAAHRRKPHIATIERNGAARCSHSGQQHRPRAQCGADTPAPLRLARQATISRVDRCKQKRPTGQRGSEAAREVGRRQYRSRSSNRGGCRRTRSAPSGARAVSAPIGTLRVPTGDGRAETSLCAHYRQL